MPQVYRSQPSRGGRQSRRARGRQASASLEAQRREQRRAQTLDRLVREGAQVPSPLFHGVQNLDANDRLPTYERTDERLDSLLIDQPEHVPDAIGREGSGVHVQQLI